MQKISIVTPSYNQGRFIEETIESVLSQQYGNSEYIIIDGGSTDNSVEIIKKYSSYLKYWVSESDNGQAHAINKGLSHCSGEIFNWLNSDDYLEPGALELIATAFEDQRIQQVAGKVRTFSEKSEAYISNRRLSAEGLICWSKGVQFVQPGVWLRRKMIFDCGGINEQFNYSFDWDLLIRYLYNFPNIKYIDDVLVNFRLHDLSKTVSAHTKFLEEETEIIEHLYLNPSFKNIHDICEYKIKRAKWTRFINKIMTDADRSRTKKVLKIITHLREQPANLGISRMTLGAIKNIILRNNP